MASPVTAKQEDVHPDPDLNTSGESEDETQGELHYKVHPDTRSMPSPDNFSVLPKPWNTRENLAKVTEERQRLRTMFLTSAEKLKSKDIEDHLHYKNLQFSQEIAAPQKQEDAESAETSIDEPPSRECHYKMLYRYGTYGPHPDREQLMDPTGLAVVSDRRVAVTSRSELTMLDIGEHDFRLHGGIPMKVAPIDVAVNRENGNIYVTTKKQLRVYSEAGAFLAKTRGSKNSKNKDDQNFSHAGGIDLNTKSKRIYVTDYEQSLVIVLDLESLDRVNTMRVMQRHRMPMQVCVHMGNLYVTETLTATVLVYMNCEDSVTAVLGSGDRNRPRFKEPCGVAGNPVNYTVAVADKQLKVIFIFDPFDYHAHLYTINDGLLFPQGLVFMPNGWLVMSEMDNTRAHAKQDAPTTHYRSDCELRCYTPIGPTAETAGAGEGTSKAN